MALGREQVAWSTDVWAALDAAVHDEFHRSAVALKFIPFSGRIDNAMTVPADVVDLDTMTINESAVVALVELGVEFGLTRQQTAAEAQNQTSVAMATRAANLLAQAEDRVIFLGDAAFDDPLFKRVQRRGGDAGLGLLGAAEADSLRAAGHRQPQDVHGQHLHRRGGGMLALAAAGAERTICARTAE